VVVIVATNGRRLEPNTKTDAQIKEIIKTEDGLVVTYGKKTQYSTAASGVEVKPKIAQRMIRDGDLVGDTGDSLFGDTPQRYCRAPRQ
jgi:hypothetical protein